MAAPDVLRYEEAPDPVLTPGEVLVRVRACALNHLDLWARHGLPRVRIRDAAHLRQRRRRRGDRVGGHRRRARAVASCCSPGLSCGRCEACLSGRDNECPAYEVLGYRSHDGGYARARQGAGAEPDRDSRRRSTSCTRRRFR